MTSLFIVLGIACFFYLFIPGIGAFLVRHKWRNFRRSIIEGSLYPRVSYRSLRSSAGGYQGNFCYFGNLQAIQGEHLLWLTDGINTVSADLYKVEVFLLPKQSDSENTTEDMPRPIKWHRIFSLPEGTRFFIAGPLFTEGRNPVFRSTKENPLVVVLYDEDDSSLLTVSITAARQRNEYWNFITYPSLAAGFLSLLVVSYSILHDPSQRGIALFALTAGFIPVISLVPPGVFLLYLYRYFWKKGRVLRAERDLVKLPLRYFTGGFEGEDFQEAVLPDGSVYKAVKIGPAEAEAYLQGENPPRLIEISKAPKAAEAGELFLFGGESGGKVVKPEEPLADYVIIPGNPVILSEKCRKGARKYELLSVLVFSLGFLLNFGILLYLLALFIQ